MAHAATGSPDDFVIATCETHSLEEFIAMVFASQVLSWRYQNDADPRLFRPTTLLQRHGNPAHALARLNWRVDTRLPALVSKLIEARSPSFA